MRIYVHTENGHEVQAVDVSEGSAIAAALAVTGADVAILLEDADDELDGGKTFGETRVANRSHVFVGRRRRVDVVVSYNGDRREREFGPNARVDRVFRWATGKKGFELSREDAAEHTLSVIPGNVIPPGDAHLGSLDDATPGRLTFALIPKHRYEG